MQKSHARHTFVSPKKGSRAKSQEDRRERKVQRASGAPSKRMAETKRNESIFRRIGFGSRDRDRGRTCNLLMYLIVVRRSAIEPHGH